MSEPTYAEMIAMAHAIQPALVDLDVIAHKPIQGEAMHKVIGYRAFDALEHIGWTWPDAHYPTVAPFHFLPNDGGEPPMKPGLRRAYAIKEPAQSPSAEQPQTTPLSDDNLGSGHLPDQEAST